MGTARPNEAPRADRASQIPAGDRGRIPVQLPLQLGDQGGLITLLDSAGLKVDGVAYTKAQACAEGWTVTF